MPVEPINFRDLIQQSGYKIIPIEQNHPVLEVLEKGLNIMLQKSKYTQFEHRRINELGAILENEIKDILERDGRIEIMALGRNAGYPDLCVRTRAGYTFIEIKTSSKPPNYDATLRVFFYTNADKITYDGNHLLVQLFLEPIPNKPQTFVFKKWQIRDLFYLKVVLKQEYNASYRDLQRLPVLRGS